MRTSDSCGSTGGNTLNDGAPPAIRCTGSAGYWLVNPLRQGAGNHRAHRAGSNHTFEEAFGRVRPQFATGWHGYNGILTRDWTNLRSWFVAIAVLWGLPSTVVAQPVITSGPNYCCWSTGIIYQALTATGGNSTYTWSLVGGALPPGISIRTDVPSYFPAGTSAGLIGVATTVGTYNFTLQVTSGGQSVTQSASMHISALILKDLGQFPDAFVNIASPPYQLTFLELVDGLVG